MCAQNVICLLSWFFTSWNRNLILYSNYFKIHHLLAVHTKMPWWQSKVPCPCFAAMKRLNMTNTPKQKNANLFKVFNLARTFPLKDVKFFIQRQITCTAREGRARKCFTQVQYYFLNIFLGKISKLFEVYLKVKCSSNAMSTAAWILIKTKRQWK